MWCSIKSHIADCLCLLCINAFCMCLLNIINDSGLMQLVKKKQLNKKSFFWFTKNEFKRHTWKKDKIGWKLKAEGMENNCVDYGLLMKMLSLYFNGSSDRRSAKRSYLDGLWSNFLVENYIYMLYICLTFLFFSSSIAL